MQNLIVGAMVAFHIIFVDLVFGMIVPISLYFSVVGLVVLAFQFMVYGLGAVFIVRRFA